MSTLHDLPWQENLLEWFDQHQREMPWRSVSSPYRTWISEVMLQQTQVDTVIPYFNRFMDRFPTIFDLAKANQDQVLKHWEGLGYYSRARNLHEAAKSLCESQNGELPQTYTELQTIKGIGPYIASAIASIAFGESVPVVDGNVFRVFSRFWALSDNIKAPKTRTLFFNKLQKEMKHYLPADFNQAMMELGALCCTPKHPNCQNCPLKPNCKAHQTQQTSEFPVTPKKKPTPHYTIVVGIIEHKDLVLITKRKPNQLLGGLWEFPGGKAKENEPLEDALHREIKEELNITTEIIGQFTPIRHAYSHFKITLHGYLCTYKSGDLICRSAETFQWVPKNAISDFAFPKANQRLLNDYLNNTIQMIVTQKQ